MNEKFSESYKKEIILKIANHLIKTEEYQCILEEDLKAIGSYYYQAWDNIKEEHLKDVIEAVENDFKTDFMKNQDSWDMLRDCIDSVIVYTLNYKYIIDNLWAKEVDSPDDYYIHILKCALENKMNYTIDETIEKDNCSLVINIDYLEDYKSYKPILVCYTKTIGNNKVITNIFTDSEFGLSEGLNVYNEYQKQDIYSKEICDLTIELLNQKGFNYNLADNNKSYNTYRPSNKEDINLKTLLLKLDTEIGSTITFANNEEKVLDNMKSANLILNRIKDILGIEF